MALENAGNLTEYDIEDIPQAQAKGTKILYTVDYNTLAESTDAAALGTYLDKVIEVVNRYKFDGVTVRYGGAMDAGSDPSRCNDCQQTVVPDRKNSHGGG